MIVRDGGQFLDPLLEAAGRHCDELVVVDTGSRDDSPRSASARGARVLHRTWDDDFAAARNASLDACTCRWVLCLDADEQLCPGDWAAVREVAGRWDAGQVAAARIVTRNYIREPWSHRGWTPVPAADPHALADRDGPVAPGYVRTAKVRLFPNLAGIRFRGCLHETVEASLARAGIPIRDVPIIVHHFGSLLEDPVKARRYLELARRKTTEEPTDAASWKELSDAALAAGDRETALQAAERTLVLAPGNAEARLTAGMLLKDVGALSRADAHLLAVAACPGVDDSKLALAFHLRAQVAMIDGRGEAAGPLLLAALRLAPGDGHIHNTLGVWHLAGGRGEPARHALERAAALLPHLAGPCLNLGRMYEAAGQAALAARQYELAMRREPGRTAAGEALGRLRQNVQLS
ncbi:MAG: glycosyltransferase [bacterium]|nr:glycosyltransferase [bacterium]